MKAARSAVYGSDFPDDFFFERLDPDVESSVRGAIARAESLGAHDGGMSRPARRKGRVNAESPE